MARGRIAVCIVLLALAGCSTAGPSATSTTTSSAPPEPAGPNPSKSAKMICSREARKNIAASLGVAPDAVTTPTWVEHRYSCTYEFGAGSVTLSVKELDDLAETKAYSRDLGTTLGRAPGGALALGQGGFVTTDGSVVVRKDWKVLLVDISALPEALGSPAITPPDVALSIAVTVVSCWSGA